ncbi:2-phospho-L-lactate guanylyltransferase [Halalkaliarchaeum desulfuricum]|uniref:2-phospho-L-lactate guanylyltransferase n=1 Tax=Halalkaliarchaeum desulfuricum TaxID=2055893 RepID=A0A343TM29_9EURY|nr:2-phospho-L-lactate guanylyltransferase [Halalkaliarchaeum desulfuricum]AUX10151.1 2-phospho-L-lactate guanylyltransferase [Halalkaliarchaeum desulfuricum]
MKILIPFDGRNPKTRLSQTLSPEERSEFSAAMLEDVLDAIPSDSLDPEVVTTEPFDRDPGVETSTSSEPLNSVVNSYIDSTVPVAVVMADLPLIRTEQVERLLETPGDVVLAPGIGGGTNALVVRNQSFSVDYHGVSVRDHQRIARNRGLSTTKVDSYRLGLDVDEPSDLIEVLLHSSGRAADWLESNGFEIVEPGGRPTVARESD